MNILDTFYATRFLYLLTRPWSKTKAFALGIIDEEGSRIKEVKLDTQERKDAYNLFIRLVFNIKRLIEKVPMGKTTIARYASALALIKESTGYDLEQTLVEHLKKQGIQLDTEHSMFIDLTETTQEAYPWFGTMFVVEDMCVTGGVDMVDKPLGTKKVLKRKKLKQVKGILDLPKSITESNEVFAGDMVFVVNSDVYNKAYKGKKRFVKYKNFVGDDIVGKSIRNYALKYPKKSIIIKDGKTGAMAYFRKVAD